MNPNIYQAGIPPTQINSLRYTGANLSVVPVVNVNRAPTVNDGQFPLFTLWRNSDPNAVSPQAEGDLWYYARVNSSVYPEEHIWLRIGTGSSGAVLQFNGDSGFALPTGAGIVSLLGQNVSGSGIQTDASGSTVSHRMLSPYTLGDFSFTNNTAATEVNLETRNNDITSALSWSRIRAVVANGSTADPFFQVGIASTRVYGFGIDNSDSDTFKLTTDPNANTATPSGGLTLLTIGSTGNTTVPAGDFQVIRSQTASGVLNIVTNTSTGGAGSDAIFQAGVLNSGGDAYLQVGVSGFGAWCAGIRNSDSDAFHISAGNTLGTGTNYIRITSAGVISFPNSGYTTGSGLYTAASGVLTSLPGGSFTFVGGTVASIPVPAITANSVVTYSTVALGTVTTVQGILTTITPGVGFVPTSNDATDTSTINWSIVRL